MPPECVAFLSMYSAFVSAVYAVGITFGPWVLLGTA